MSNHSTHISEILVCSWYEYRPTATKVAICDSWDIPLLKNFCKTKLCLNGYMIKVLGLSVTKVMQNSIMTDIIIQITIILGPVLRYLQTNGNSLKWEEVASV